MLICSVVERDPGAVRPIAGLIAFAVRMANMLPIESRVVLAERMRDAADEIEQRRQKVPIECGPLFSSSSCSGSHAAGLSFLSPGSKRSAVSKLAMGRDRRPH